ncbi:M23 family metallopeptidase [Neptunitalea lumnitzerae]|uniref:Peptidase M23 n=1 Tax=Neptunitalea lumnitzerae TaxID=2965509 RepID=A0ABQ5ME75_9FLAO|nr:M23 family metallopeptidase [Neptunitalea sp. Y10]GLB47672.1 peptidase M23 [Neptunitalea sp. Y10]
MAKVKYYYDPDSLSYRKIETKKGKKIRNLALFFTAAAIAGAMGAIILLNLNIINTPKELALERENKQLKLNFQLLNKDMSQLEEVVSYLEDKDNNIYRVYFEADPIPDNQRTAGFGGVNRYSNLEGYDNSEMIIEARTRMDILKKRISIQSKSLDEIVHLAEDKEEFLEKIPAIQPVRNEDLKRMASGYGWRSDPFTKARKFHYGMDFSAKTGTPIYATGDGVVARADNRATGFGNHIRIDHGYGYLSIYAHLSKYNVRKGQKVKRGDIIGYVGNTGRSRGPHLHYEVWKDDERINPMNFYYGSLTEEEFDAMLKASSLENQSLD